MSHNKFKVKFELKYIYLFLILIVLLGIVIFKFAFYDRNIPFGIIEVMAYLTGSVAILTLIYHALSLESSHSFHDEDLKLKRHQYSYEIVSKMNEPSMSKTLQVMYEINLKRDKYFQKNDISEFKKYLENNRDKRANIVMLINYFEHISLLVKNQHVEEDIIKDSFKTIFIYTYTLLKPYIDDCQANSRKIWINFEGLAEKWSKEK
jgi:hypothetical protein